MGVEEEELAEGILQYFFLNYKKCMQKSAQSLNV